MTRFSRANNAGTAVCYICGKATWKGYADQQCDLCKGCFDDAGLENEHNDGAHTFDAKCPMCDPDAAARRLDARKNDGAARAERAKQTVARADARQAAKPHCPNCGQERPKTKATERGERPLCSNCSGELDVRYFIEMRNFDLAIEGIGKYVGRRRAQSPFFDETLANQFASTVINAIATARK